jgi:ATP-dependent helicase/nuclease subunit B
LHGPDLKTSVSRIEQYAACPFRFFVESGLKAGERRLYEMDPREKGSFQHKVLEEFHNRLKRDHLRWRDVTPSDARQRVAAIAAELAPLLREGMFDANAPARFAAQAMARSLQDFISVAVGWMRQYDFDPEAAELGFGGKGGLPGWELDLGDGNRLIFSGIIDRIDLCGLDEDTAFVVVIDYKSSDKKLEKRLMANGIQLQLPAYLSVLRGLKEPDKTLRFKRLIPAGVFYVNLNGRYSPGSTRAEVLNGVETSGLEAYRHMGRFDTQALNRLDNRSDAVAGTQFKFRRTKNGLHKGDSDPMPSEDFSAMLDQVESHLRRMGGEIFNGNIAPDPYQNGHERACDKCDFAAICRIDPWTHKFRALA